MAEQRSGGGRKRSILARFFFLVCIMILGPILLTLLVFYRTIPDRMEEQAQGNADFYMGQVASSVESSMDLARDVAYSAMADNDLRQAMLDPASYLAVDGRDALLRVVGGVAAYQSTWHKSGLNSVYLFRQDGQFALYSPTGSYAQEQQRMQQVYAAAAGLTSVETLFRVPGTPSGTLYFLLDYKNISNLDLLGKLIMEIDVETMVNAADLIDLYPGTCLALSGQDGQLLFGLGEDLELLLDRAGTSGAYVQGATAGRLGRYYHVSQQVGGNDLQLDFFVPLSSMYDLVWEGSGIFSVLCVAILLLAILAALVIYRVMRRAMQGMEDTLHRMAESDYTARMPDSGYRELASLESAFNRMADNLDASFQDAYQKGLKLQESESRLLAAQINPHFIFNVLEAINMRCVDAGLKDISHMVTNLANLLRGNIGIGSGNQKITLEQELGYVRYYLDLQRQRFGESLVYSIEQEDDELLQYLVPRLTIQPLVENAIVHGLEPRRGLGSVTIRLWEEEHSICVRVEDDGVGFDVSKLDLSGEAAAAGDHNHIALPNVIRRLHLLYGEQADLKITSEPGRGTSVLLILPIDQTEG